MSNVTLKMSPMQWANLKDIHEVEPINDTDYECLAEIREILEKHNKRERFGVALLHKHFDMANDELLVEQSDKNERVLTIKPVKKKSAGKMIETIWALRDGDKSHMLDAQQHCAMSGHPET